MQLAAHPTQSCSVSQELHFKGRRPCFLLLNTCGVDVHTLYLPLLVAETLPGYEAYRDGSGSRKARLCPQKYYCPGNVDVASEEIRGSSPCPGGKWTRELGARSIDQCCEYSGSELNQWCLPAAHSAALSGASLGMSGAYLQAFQWQCTT